MSASPKFPPVAEQFVYLRKGSAEIIREEELREKIEKSYASGTPLRVYLGVDPTAPDLHLGHTVVLRKLKHFQDMGHTAIFLIGDFSAMIGDPTGQSETRPPLTREQVDANAKTYLSQVYKILDEKKTEVRYNSEWLGKMSSFDVVRLCGKYRLARMLEREDFRNRLDKGLPISVHEILYPLLTAYDAVSLKTDVELGATEQKFNILVHREIQREYGLPPQVVFTMPILVGLDGERKMSKSLGNYVGITEPPSEMFTKLMKISDDLMWKYIELLTDRKPNQVDVLRNETRAGTTNPKRVKSELAREIIAGFHGPEAAELAANEWERVHSKRELPSEMRTIPIPHDISDKGEVRLSHIITYCEFAASRAEADRLIKAGAVEWDGEKILDANCFVDTVKPAQHILKVGKKQIAYVRIGLQGH